MEGLQAVDKLKNLVACLDLPLVTYKILIGTNRLILH